MLTRASEVPLSALTVEERKRLLMSVGTHRGTRTLSPVEVARLLKRAVNRGATLAECASGIGLETTQVGRFLALLGLPEDVQDLVGWGKSGATLSFSAAFELSRLEGADDQRAAVAATLEEGLGKAEVQQLVQMRKRSQLDIGTCLQAILKMRPQVTVRHVFVGTIKDRRLADALAGMAQGERDSLLRGVLASAGEAYGAGGRLGPNRFTLSGNEHFGLIVKAGRDALEERVNIALLREAGL